MALTDKPSDAQLVARILAGDQTQYRLLVERHQRAVFNAAYRLLGNPDEAADITQDAFLRAYNALNSFQRDKPLAPWLCQIAINLSLNRLKRQKPVVSLNDERENKPALEIADMSSEPQATLLQVEQQQRLRQAILLLPPEQRVVIEMRHFQEQSYQEIADTLEISLTNVKSRIFRARKSLRKILEETDTL